MRFRAALALAVALSVPVWAQHQTGAGAGVSVHGGGGGGQASGAFRGGPSGYGGGHGAGYSAGHPGYGAGHGAGYGSGHGAGYAGAPSYSGLTGLQAPSAFSQPGRFPILGGLQSVPRAGVVLPYGTNPGYGQRYGSGSDHRGRDPHRGPYRGGHDHDRDRHNRGWGSYGYSPGYVYAYPYVADQGFYDWGATDYSENDQGPYAGAPDQGSEDGYSAEPPPPPGYSEAPYPQQQQPVQPSTPDPSVAPQRQEYHFASASPAAATPISSKPLTVIFKGGRAPEKMQNYMVTSSALTNLDGEHFEKIPLDQVDIAATQQANRRSGIDFEVPTASHD